MQGHHLTQSQRATLRAEYLDGLSLQALADRYRISRRTVCNVIKDIKRGYASGWRDGVCACGPAGWSPVQDQLDRRKLLDEAMAGEPIALRRLNAMGVKRWERAGEIIIGTCHR